VPAKAISLTEEIRRGAVAVKKGPASWFCRLTPDIQQELIQVRADFLSGKMEGTKTALARGIHGALSGRGLITVTRSEILRWVNAAS
jgi:hypothetical protein